MSEARQTEIMEQNIQTGWTSEKITAAGAETKTVKASAGKVARLFVVGTIDVTLKDNTTAKWAMISNNASLDMSATPIQCNANIKLTFSGAGSAWIVYR